MNSFRMKHYKKIGVYFKLNTTITAGCVFQKVFQSLSLIKKKWTFNLATYFEIL